MEAPTQEEEVKHVDLSQSPPGDEDCPASEEARGSKKRKRDKKREKKRPRSEKRALPAFISKRHKRHEPKPLDKALADDISKKACDRMAARASIMSHTSDVNRKIRLAAQAFANRVACHAYTIAQERTGAYRHSKPIVMKGQDLNRALELMGKKVYMED